MNVHGYNDAAFLLSDADATLFPDALFVFSRSSLTQHPHFCNDMSFLPLCPYEQNGGMHVSILSLFYIWYSFTDFCQAFFFVLEALMLLMCCFLYPIGVLFSNWNGHLFCFCVLYYSIHVCIINIKMRFCSSFFSYATTQFSGTSLLDFYSFLSTFCFLFFLILRASVISGSFGENWESDGV